MGNRKEDETVDDISDMLEYGRSSNLTTHSPQVGTRYYNLTMSCAQPTEPTEPPARPAVR